MALRGMGSNRPEDDFEDEDDDPGPTIDDLIEQNHPALQDILAEAITDRRKSYRMEAAFRLVELFQDVRAVPVLAEALDDHDRHIRKSAAEALWEIGDTDTPGLIAFLKHSYGQSRDLIAGALSRIGWQADDLDSECAYLIAARDWRGCVLLGSQAVPHLLPVLGDPDGAARRAAAWALGEIGDPAAVEGLSALLNDTEGGLFGVGDRVCDIASEALQRIGTPEALDAFNRWGADFDEAGAE